MVQMPLSIICSYLDAEMVTYNVLAATTCSEGWHKNNSFSHCLGITTPIYFHSQITICLAPLTIGPEY